MRKDVLISLLAITGAPVAALADADVVIDKTAWSGDDLTVSEDGSVTVSTGKEVSIEKERSWQVHAAACHVYRQCQDCRCL